MEERGDRRNQGLRRIAAIQVAQHPQIHTIPTKNIFDDVSELSDQYTGNSIYPHDRKGVEHTREQA